MQQVLTNEHIATMKINGGNKKISPPKSGREPAEFKKSFQVMISLSDPDFDRRKVHIRIYYVQINIIGTEGDSQRPQMVGVQCTLVYIGVYSMYTDHNNKISTKAGEGRPLDPLIKCSKMLLLQYY